MARVFIAYEGDTVYADGKKLFDVIGILDIPFHVTITPYGENPRRMDVNSRTTIPLTNDNVHLKVGEPLMLDPDFSIMTTRIFNNKDSYCRISVRCDRTVDLRRNDEKISAY